MDLGCGYGYSTLSFAMLIDQIVKEGDTVHLVGADIFDDFLEKCRLNQQKYKSHFQNQKDIKVDFKS